MPNDEGRMTNESGENSCSDRGGDLKKRLMDFALRCVKLAEFFPRTPTGQTVARQLVKAATSVAANYRAACRARSKAEFIAKLGIVEEEADESLFWIELAVAAELCKPDRVEYLMIEANAIVAIIVSSKKTARQSKSR